jgi:hypothetical protein
MSTRRDAPYDVGFGKPPAANKFKPGHSGNPKGRPKGTLNLATTIQKALRERITVVENGKRRLISKFEALITQLVNRAVKGDARAIQLLLSVLTRLFSGDAASASSIAASGDEQKVIAGILERLDRSQADAITSPKIKK